MNRFANRHKPQLRLSAVREHLRRIDKKKIQPYLKENQDNVDNINVKALKAQLLENQKLLTANNLARHQDVYNNMSCRSRTTDAHAIFKLQIDLTFIKHDFDKKNRTIKNEIRCIEDVLYYIRLKKHEQVYMLLLQSAGTTPFD
jgi:hypothetical protein